MANPGSSSRYGATNLVSRLLTRNSSEDMAQLVQGQRTLFRSLSGAPDRTNLLQDSTEEDGRTLGTLKGVFAPVSLSMFSALLFLRMGYIVGNAGFLETVLQFLIAYTILVSTVFSICAIATNGAVKGGGVYFMLSRTMGPEFGGSIGILFYFANVVSSALYVTACVEGITKNFGPEGAFMELLPDGKWWNILYSSSFNIFNFLLCLVGAELFGKTSIIILAIVTLCCTGVISSFFLDNYVSTEYNVTISNGTANWTEIVNGTFSGLSWNSLEGITELWYQNLYPTYIQDCEDSSAKVSFFTVFGVLFSGTTGIMAGANLSGELKNPGKSIPRGTLSGCAFTFVTFIILSVLTSLTCNPVLLHQDCMYMVHFTFWKWLVLIGVIFATWSASLSNLIGASRVLQAVAEDTMFGPFLHFILKGKISNNPIVSVLTTSLLVQICFFLGGLNQIAQLCSVLFLLSYASVNLACLGLVLSSAPNFRPAFKYFSWHTSLVGLIGTSIMMFLISPLFAAIAILLCLSLILALNFLSPARNSNWGSISQALIFHQVRKYLLLLDPRKSHVKFWRPQILLLVHNPRSTCALIDFVNAMKKGGLYVLGHVTSGDLAAVEEDPITKEYPDWLGLVDHLKVKAFVEVTMASSVRNGIEQLIRVSGIGAMKPNTILLGFRDDSVHSDDLISSTSPYCDPTFHDAFPSIDQNYNKISCEEYVGCIQDTLKLQKNIGLCRNFQLLDRNEVFSSELKYRIRAGRKRYLDVWPVNFLSGEDTDITDNTSLFLFQLACIVNMVPKWRKHQLRVFMCVRAADSDIAGKEADLIRLLELLRIKAETHVLIWDHLTSLFQAESSQVLTEECEEPNISQEYLLESNEFIRSKCVETAVSFIYLPRPPVSPDLHVQYLHQLDLLTRGLPPSILVHGVSPVMTTTL
ncbi:solute carrier family 12 member 9-like isoform X4 [Eurytemora carolleeae]|nr:solute carrier family 12 member 9-like isoform X2 [Eurytemora carolleeae]XP_023327940.1 solute carrier family 12 member 9-like isoform X3 [Eurytemora carolleeae]XP_023327941.1 solute carrier family 12 member 9-like isoform X4 [Eurytemora carolleeae]|eukprot:XP_023327939.1 solute carrier family 12 member 9-like isoform X2 [Eurytemora affinis]